MILPVQLSAVQIGFVRPDVAPDGDVVGHRTGAHGVVGGVADQRRKQIGCPERLLERKSPRIGVAVRGARLNLIGRQGAEQVGRAKCSLVGERVGQRGMLVESVLNHVWRGNTA